MRRIPLILGLVLITGFIIRDVYEFFVTNEGLQYFSSKPTRLIYLMLLAVAGGLVAFGISHLSPASQRKLKLVALGGFGGILVVALAFFSYLFYHLAVAGLGETLKWAWLAWAMVFVPMAVAAGFVWLEFRRVWRQPR